MKKILAIAAVAALTAGVSAFAANPFSDVSQDDWAYQAVSDLSDQGVVEGYPDGTFKGERNITRYELAQIVARLMAKEDQLNAEQRATLDKLSGEYADELANLGVRVGNLEKKVGNLYWSGDARMQYQHNLKEDARKGHDDAWTGRMRINVMGEVNDQVTVNGRLVQEMDFKDNNDGNVSMDRLYAAWTPNDKVTVNVGKFGVALDQTGTFWDEDGAFKGVNAAYDNGKFGVEAGYGRFADAGNLDDAYEAFESREAWYAKLTGHVADRADVSAFYLKNTQKFDDPAGVEAKAWGAGAAVDLGAGFTLDGDYVQTKLNKGLKDADLWTAGLTYGEVDTDKVGSWQLGVHYVDAEKNSMILGNSALDMTDQLDLSSETGVKFWVAKAGVAVQKNVELDAYYNFAAKFKGNHKEALHLKGFFFYCPDF